MDVIGLIVVNVGFFVGWIGGIRVGHEELEREGKVAVLLGSIEPSANLGVMILIVPRPARDLDLGYVGVFGPVC